MHPMRFMVSLVVAAAMSGACVSDLSDAGEPELGTTSLAGDVVGDPCMSNVCGGNSTVMDGVFFNRMHLGGLPNPQGIVITGVTTPDGRPLQLQLVGGERLRGIRVDNGAVLDGAGLEGVTIHVTMPAATTPPTTKPYTITIHDVGVEESWVAGNDWVLPPLVETYELHYRDEIPDHSRHLCAGEEPGKVRALVFGGDLYNPETLAIETGPSTAGWFNIACIDSAIYKMHKIGYTSAAGARFGFSTAVRQRRAMLNAWTANVCGTGTLFTRPGEPITLRESLDVQSPIWSPYVAASQTIEAIWDENGAVCMNVPRLADKSPTIASSIAAECGPLPPCDSMLADWATHGYVLTGNPSP